MDWLHNIPCRRYCVALFAVTVSVGWRSHTKRPLQQRGRRILFSMLSVPALLLLAWEASPESLHWKHTQTGSLFGIVSWLTLSLLGFLDFIDPWRAITLVVEFVFGLVPVVYLLLDFTGHVHYRMASQHLVRQEIVLDALYETRIFSAIPSVLMAKQMARTAVDMTNEYEPAAINFCIDLVEVMMWMLFGIWNSPDAGQWFFIIYCGVPAVVSSLWLDYLVLRIFALNRANCRLMQSAFAAVVRVDGLKDAKVMESNVAFDALVGGAVAGTQLKTLFSAKQTDMNRLWSPSSDRIVRRLRTTICCSSKCFQQDVELRVLSATEKELQKEQGMMLGVSIMGERLPYTESDHCVTSVLMEQHLDEIGHVMISDVGKVQINDVPEVVEVNAFDSASAAGVKAGRKFKANRPRFDSGSGTSTVLSSWSGSAFLHRTDTVDQDAAMNTISDRGSTPYGDAWQASHDVAYLKECSLSHLEELISSWNHNHTFCCNWHVGVHRLIAYAEEMRGWRSCSGTWPSTNPLWQCSHCSALQFEDADGCWLCLSLRE